jgi:hypothetical protein
MEHKHIVASVVIVTLLVGGMFFYTYLKKNEMSQKLPVANNPTLIDPYAAITRIDAKHFYSEEKHTLVGEIPMPTQCDLLDWKTRARSSDLVVDFVVINNSSDCAEVVTPQRFKAILVGGKDIPISATLNGREVILNLIPGKADETPDDYELFIKG